MYVYKSMAESRVTNAHHIINSALTGSAAQRGRDAFGTATRISASLLRRLSAFFRSVSDQGPKAAKLAVLIPGPGMLVNVRNAPRVVIPPPTQNTTCFAVCALVCDPLSRAECVPIFTRESKRGPFVPEVLKTVWTMCWKRWYDCVSCAFHGFFEDEKESRIKGWRRNRRSAQSLLPAVRAVDRDFNAGGCGVYFRKSQNGWRLCSRKRRRFNENKRALQQIGGNYEQK